MPVPSRPCCSSGRRWGATGFGTLAGHFTDRTVVTYDPRGAGRSKRTDGARRTEDRGASRRSAPADPGAWRRAGGHLRQQRRRRQRACPGGRAPGAGPYPGGARAAVRPGAAGPRARCWPRARASARLTSARALARRWRVHRARQLCRARSRPASPDQPGPDPAGFGLPTEDDGSRDDALLGLNILSTPGYGARFRCTPGSTDPYRRRRRSAIGHDAGWPRRHWRGRTARHGTRHLRGRPRRIRWRRVRRHRRAGCLRRHPARGTRRGRSPGLTRPRPGDGGTGP